MTVKSLTKKKAEAEKEHAAEYGGTLPDIEKVKFNLFLKGTWNATLTTDNKIYIEVIRGQMLDKEKWDQVKKMAPLPAELFETIEGTLQGIGVR